MQTYNATRQPGDWDELIRKLPERGHYDTLITEDTRIELDGRLVGIYCRVPKEALGEMRRVATTTKFVSGTRVRGLPTRSSVFGALPRVPVRTDFCRFSAQSRNEPANLKTAFDFSEYLCDIYRRELPEEYAHHAELIEGQIGADWRISETPFTTCNFNVNHAIKYHRDTGNFRGTYSNVLILKDGIEGGELVFPEFGFALEQSDGALAIFDGQALIHGVMPIRRRHAKGYRASIVFYALEKMKDCYPFAEETRRIQILRTEREERRRAKNRAELVEKTRGRTPANQTKGSNEQNKKSDGPKDD